MQAFCATNFGVRFPVFAKIEDNGTNAHPLDRHLESAKPGRLGIEAIKWNFTKFVVARQINAALCPAGPDVQRRPDERRWRRNITPDRARGPFQR